MGRGNEGGDDAAFMATSAPGLTDESAPPLEPGVRLGPWKILEPIDTGGMGAVYRAERADGLYGQNVAVKLIRGLDGEQVRRFEGERQRLAQMDHPGIAPIIDGGTAPDGRPYMVMGLVEGSPIDSAMDARGADERERVRCFVALCDAVAHAHGRLILHQDIKPANVLVDVSGQPRLIDFGISNDLRDGEETPFSGLTLRYGAPEQLRGEPGSVQTDVFSLGVLLFVLLTRCAPRRADDGSIDLGGGEPLDADLRAVIARATASSADSRYRAVELLASDLEAWLEKRPVEARNGGRVYRIGKFFRRYPVGSTAGVIAVLALAGGLGASLKFGAEARREASRAQAALTQAEYQYEKADAFLTAQTVLNDLLLSAYGGEEGGAESLTATLMGRWRSAHEAATTQGDDPVGAATLAFALGRNLYLRRDFASAIEVFSSWLEAAYGSEILREAGEHLYALSLYDSGRLADAIPHLRRSLGSATQNRHSAADRFNLAFRLAKATYEESALQRVAEVFEEYRAENEGADLNVNQRIEQHATAYQVHTIRQDYRAAVDELEAIVELCNRHPDAAPSMRGNARSLLALNLLYALEDYSGAEDVARSLVTDDVERVGENMTTAHGYMLLAEAQRERGAFDEALVSLDRARQLNRRYANGSETGTVAENLIRARVFIDQGQLDTASELVQSVYEGWRSLNPEPAVAPVDLRLSLVWIESMTGLGPENPLAGRLGDLVIPSDLRSVSTNWLYRRMSTGFN